MPPEHWMTRLQSHPKHSVEDFGEHHSTLADFGGCLGHFEIAVKYTQCKYTELHYPKPDCDLNGPG